MSGLGTTTVPVLLVRHGQSEWNAIHRWQGTADSPLTALGREQAAQTALVLAGLDTSFDTLWSSDLSRAAETAAIIGGVLGLDEQLIDDRLREAHAGEWEGLTPETIEAGWPGWLATHRRPASFEPFESVVRRATAALVDIAAHTAALPGSVALVVAHSGVIRSIVRQLGRHDERVPNLGGVWVTVAVAPPGSTTPGARIELGDLFDPQGVVVSGIDIPGEDPGDQPDQPDADRRPQR
jgi:probable phosphoglycerate mutase